MKKTFLLLAILVASTHAILAEDNHLYIQPNTGELQAWEVPSLQKISFQDGNVLVTKKSGSTAYLPISSVKRIYICTPSANKIDIVEGKVPYAWEGEKLLLNEAEGTPITVYSVTGTVVLQERLSESYIDFHGIRNGLYLVNVNGRIFKVIKK